MLCDAILINRTRTRLSSVVMIHCANEANSIVVHRPGTLKQTVRNSCVRSK